MPHLRQVWSQDGKKDIQVHQSGLQNHQLWLAICGDQLSFTADPDLLKNLQLTLLDWLDAHFQVIYDRLDDMHNDLIDHIAEAHCRGACQFVPEFKSVW